VIVTENKQDKKLSSLPFGRNIPDFCVHVTHWAVDGRKQQVVASPAPRVSVSPGWFSYQIDQEIIMIRVRFTMNDVEG
jgi:hypothetical protein